MGDSLARTYARVAVEARGDVAEQVMAGVAAVVELDFGAIFEGAGALQSHGPSCPGRCLLAYGLN